MRSLTRYGLDAIVVIAAFLVCLLAMKVYQTFERVDALWAWANQVQQAQAARPTATLPAPTPAGK